MESLNTLAGGGNPPSGPGSLLAILREIRGLGFTLVAGAAANTKINVAAIRQEDTILFGMNNNAGTLTDITANLSIVDLHASGTVTVGTRAAGDTVTVNGRVYTLVAVDTVIGENDFSKVSVGASANECAANLAEAINAREKQQLNGGQVRATVATNVVTVTAIVEGVAGNAYTLAETGNTFTVSGATLSGGNATGGIKSTSATNQILLVWYNKQ